MFTSLFTTLAVVLAPVLCIIFSNQDRIDFDAQFPNGVVSEECGVIHAERQMWDRDTHVPLDKYVIGAQVLANPDCAAAFPFLEQLPQEDVNPVLDLVPVEE